MSKRKAPDNANNPKLKRKKADAITVSIQFTTRESGIEPEEARESVDSIQLTPRESGIGPEEARESVDAGIKSLDDHRQNEDKLNPHQSNPNRNLCEKLIEVANHERNINKNVLKYNTYRKAAATLASLAYKVESGEQARKIRGIGKSIAQLINEFLQTGKLQMLVEITADGETTPTKMSRRESGIGPKKARESVDLRKNEDKLDHHPRIGSKYVDDFKKKIPRKEVQRIETFLKDSLFYLDPEYEVTICGSYRRGQAESGDIDVLITHQSYTSSDSDGNKKGMLESVVEHLEIKQLIVDRISMGDLEFKGVCRDPEGVNKVFRRLNIRLSPKDHYYCALLHLTGSDSFNMRMRKHAERKKFTLNEYTLQRDAETINSEKDIFKKLGLPYKEPEERNS